MGERIDPEDIEVGLQIITQRISPVVLKHGVKLGEVYVLGTREQTAALAETYPWWLPWLPISGGRAVKIGIFVLGD